MTLRLLRGDQVLFESAGRWLHPLFELEAVFAAGLDPAGTRLQDRITGRAAAFLVARLGVKELQTGLLSRRAIPVLERFGIVYQGLQVVQRVACATEDLLGDMEDPEAVYGLLVERRRRALARQAGS